MADTNTKSLELVFISGGSKEVTVVVKDPKEGLTLAEAQAVMATIIAKNVFASTSGDLRLSHGGGLFPAGQTGETPD